MICPSVEDFAGRNHWWPPKLSWPGQAGFSGVCMSWVFCAHVVLLEFHDDFVFVLIGFVLLLCPTWALEVPHFGGLGMLSAVRWSTHKDFRKRSQNKTYHLAKQRGEVSADGDFVAPHHGLATCKEEDVWRKGAWKSCWNPLFGNSLAIRSYHRPCHSVSYFGVVVWGLPLPPPTHQQHLLPYKCSLDTRPLCLMFDMLW